MHARTLVAVLSAATLLAACGSTVPRAQRAARARQSTGGEFGGPLTTNADGSLTQTTDAAGGVVTLNGATGRGNASSGGGTAGSGGAAAFGPGVTATTIFIGSSYATGNGPNAAIGAGGISQGDPQAEDKAMIDEINTHGGIAGRKVQGVFHAVDSNSTAAWDVTDQQACDDWTQDHKIFAALAEPIADSDTLAGCLDSRGVSFVSTALTTSDSARFARFPAYVELISMNLDRTAVAEVAALKAQGWFSGWDTATGGPAQTKAKLGVVTYDGAAWAHAVDQTLVPALRALGYAPDPRDIIRVPHEQATADTGSTGAATSSAVLKLRGDGVTHVIILDRKALLTLFFTRAAQSQRYFPRYGLNSQNGVQALIDGAALPTQQMTGAKGIGWLPTLDLPAAVSAQAAYTNATKKQCLAIMKAHNITFTDANAETVGMNTCSSWLFLRAAINASGGELTRAGFIRGVNQLGSSFLAAPNFADKYTPTQHDGVGAYRDLVFDAGCSCMNYTSGDIAAP